VEPITGYTGKNMIHGYNFGFVGQKPFIIILLTV